MASLKEVKDRIDSVTSTMKITSAMKMIASAKMRKSQQAITSFLPYSTKLNEILIDLLSSDSTIDTPYSKNRVVGKVGIVAFTSNTSLCGGFNANILKELSANVKKYSETIGLENIEIYPIGKKVADYAKKKNLKIVVDEAFNQMADKPSFMPVMDFSKQLVHKFLSCKLDKIVLIYTHFQSMASQKVVVLDYLPFDIKSILDREENNLKAIKSDYILEPSIEELLSNLIPQVLASNLYAALLDSNASENAARSLAMQIATDNANQLVDDLTIEYNKNRQSAITNELLDIIGGAAALEN